MRALVGQQGSPRGGHGWVCAALCVSWEALGLTQQLCTIRALGAVICGGGLSWLRTGGELGLDQEPGHADRRAVWGRVLTSAVPHSLFDFK